MGILHKISSTIEKFKGLEKRQSDLIDKPGYLNEMVNANIRASGSLSKRKGWHSIAEPGLDLEAADGTVDPLLGIARWQGKNPNVDSDTLQAEVLIAKKDLNRLSIEKITFVNSSPEIVGISNTIYLNILPDESGQMIMKIGKAGSTAFSATKNLGTGKGHLDDITVQDLKDWIATLNIDLELRGEGTNGALNNGSVKAAFLLPFKSQSILRDTSFERDLYFLDVVPTPTGTSFSFFEGLKAKYDTGSKDFQNISSTVINGCTYFTTGYDKLCKYDGSKVYLAGLPTPDFGVSNTYSPVRAGSVSALTYNSGTDDNNPVFNMGANADPRNVGLLEDTNTNDAFYYYLVVYEYTDAQGNTIRSNQSVKIKWDPVTINHGHRHIAAVKIPTLKNGIGNPGDGFDVENIKILVYRSARVEEGTVEASSFYPITQNNSDGTSTMVGTYGNDLPTGARVDLLTYTDANGDTQFFPSNVTENTTGPSTYDYTFTNGALQNDPSVDYVVYYDFTPHDDTALDQNGQDAYDDGPQGSETDLVFAAVESPDFIPVGDYPEGRHDLPPMCKYITNHQGCLVLSNRVSKDANGNIVTDSPTEIFFSLVQFNDITGEIGTEYFPSNTNSVLLEGVNGGEITGIKTLKDNLYIFHENTVSTLSGDIAVIGNQSLRQDLLSSQGETGSFSHHALQEYEGNLTFLSEEGLMTISTSQPFPVELSANIKPLMIDKKINRKAVVSFFTADDDVMGFMLPVQDTGYATDVFINTALTATYVFDVKNKAWHTWTNVDISGGIERVNTKTYFISRNNGQIHINIFKKEDNITDFADHVDPIKTTIVTAWDSLGDPAVFKKYIRMNLLITDSNEKFDGASFKLNLYLRKDFSTVDIGPIQFNSSVLGGWGITEWGLSGWGDRPFHSVKTKLFGKAKSIAFKFENEELNENILISGYTMETASPYQPEIKE
jgi:hypothetical protein